MYYSRFIFCALYLQKKLVRKFEIGLGLGNFGFEIVDEENMRYIFRKTTEFFDEGSYRIFPPTGPHITWITAGKKCKSLGPDWKLAQFNSRNDFYSEACFIFDYL